MDKTKIWVWLIVICTTTFTWIYFDQQSAVATAAVLVFFTLVMSGHSDWLGTLSKALTFFCLCIVGLTMYIIGRQELAYPILGVALIFIILNKIENMDKRIRLLEAKW